jgi:membrane-associated phospholipid phosphatase
VVAPLLAAVPVLLVTVARVYRGMHYPTDVLAGFVLGAGAVYAAVRVVERGRREELAA